MPRDTPPTEPTQRIRMQAERIRMQAECMALDKPIAEKYPCPECGSSMSYKPIFTETSYRAFVVCDNSECDYEDEF